MIRKGKSRTHKLSSAINVTLVILCISAIALTGFSFLFACNNDDDLIDNTPTFILQEYDIPDNLPSYALTLEWFQEDGSDIAFNPNKPSVILFTGKSKYDKKDSYTLPVDIYSNDSDTTDNILSSNSLSMNLELAYYWRKLGFNVGIFHFENFADDTNDNINKKAYSSKDMTYIDVDGNLVEDSNIDFTLTEAFVMEWMKLVTSPKNVANTGTVVPNKMMELRLIGNGSGANIAIAVAEYLSNLARDGFLQESKSPTRVTLIDPWLDNAKINLEVDYKSDKIDSILNYNSAIVKELYESGIAFELIETDNEFFYRYENPYSGLVPVAPSNELITDTNTEQIGISGDSQKYNVILQSSASLYLRETFSSYYTDEYKELERAGLDWYLYTARGTDNQSILYNGTVYSSYTYAMGYESTAPILDDFYEKFSTTFVRYGLSAWTPTPYISAVAGVAFSMITKANTDTNGDKIPLQYTLANFQSEAYQVSDKSGVYIVGFVTSSKDGTNYLNLGASTRIKNALVKIEVTYTGAGSGLIVKTKEVRTDSRGFYEYKLQDEELAGTIKILVEAPHGYSFCEPQSTGGKKYEELMYANLGESGTSVANASDAANYPFMYYFYNATIE
ncbi:MAG: hypothetical protein LBF68_02830 [Christensenellaceae bacterium]|jgi:hypothetical protein|nr:hypothetical protein [Christensenellaceae bacterium]